MKQLTDEVRDAMRMAFNLGQTYWRQADSESIKQQNKSDATREQFEALMEETVSALDTAQPEPVNAMLVEALDNYIDDTLDVSEMDEVAHRFAHPLALELECVLADRNANWDRAMNLIGEYRSAMNAIHGRESPTFMGEPVLGGQNDAT